MAGTKRKLYWDTCIFLAWIKGETCWPEDVLKGIEQSVEEWNAGRLIVVTSTITMLEILSAELTADQKLRFTKAFAHPGLQPIDVDRRVSGRASVIRQFYDDRIFDLDGKLVSGRVIDSLSLPAFCTTAARARSLPRSRPMASRASES
ncbi:MAG: hypothetical protein WDO18_22110 [Acidobacteriota bacterium]